MPDDTLLSSPSTVMITSTRCKRGLHNGTRGYQQAGLGVVTTLLHKLACSRGGSQRKLRKRDQTENAQAGGASEHRSDGSQKYLRRTPRSMKIGFATKQLQVENSGKIADLKVQGLQTKLLNGVLARRQLRGEDAQHADHGHAAVVELLAPHLWRVHLQAHGVAKVARLILRGLPPC